MGLFSSKSKSKITKENDQDSTPQTQATVDAEVTSNETITDQPASKNLAQDSEQPDLSPEDARKHAAIGKQLAAAFGELVTMVMRSETDRKRPIADLEWMIAPAIATGQFAIADAQSKKTGAISPVGAVLWAMVSDEVDQRLSNATEQQPRLEPKDWKSGTIPWIVLAMGDKRVIAGLIKKLTQDVFQNQEPKIRSRDKDGNIVIGRVRLSETNADATDAS